MNCQSLNERLLFSWGSFAKETYFLGALSWKRSLVEWVRSPFSARETWRSCDRKFRWIITLSFLKRSWVQEKFHGLLLEQSPTFGQNAIFGAVWLGLLSIKRPRGEIAGLDHECVLTCRSVCVTLQQNVTSHVDTLTHKLQRSASVKSQLANKQNSYTFLLLTHVHGKICEQIYICIYIYKCIYIHIHI